MDTGIRKMNHILIDERNVIPSKVICIGRNYVEHIKELNNETPDEMVVFFKPNSAISNQLNSFQQEPLHYEGELCFVIESNQLSAVGFGLDLTKRQLQSQLKTKGLPWERAKAFDGAAVFSPFVKIKKNDFQDLNFELHINQKLIQLGNLSLMMYQPDKILEELKSFISLNDGDIIMTGTPKGVGVINKGDVFEAKVKRSNQDIISTQWVAK